MMLRWLRAIRWLADRLPCRRIEGEDGSLYLLRYKLFGWMPGDRRRWQISVYLHRFARPDMDDAPHNHPWRWAFAIVLAGGYQEVRATDKTPGGFVARVIRRRGGSISVLRSSTYHRVDELFGETWTLFVAGPKSHSWGFWVPDGRGHVPWRERLTERGISL